MSATVAASQLAIQANAQANRAEEVACQSLMSGYDAGAATVEQMRAYARCVDILYPQAMSSDSILFFKVCVIALVIGLVIGLVKGITGGGTVMGRLLDGLLLSMVGAAAGPLVVAVFVFIFKAVRWAVFS